MDARATVLSFNRTDLTHAAAFVPIADIATVIEGQQYLPSSRQLPYGGQDVTRLLGDLLAKRGVRVSDESHLTVLKELAARVPTGGDEDEVMMLDDQAAGCARVSNQTLTGWIMHVLVLNTLTASSCVQP